MPSTDPTSLQHALSTTILQSLEQLYLTSHPREAPVHRAYAALLTTLSDWFHQYQQQQSRLESAIRSERSWRKRLERRVQILESSQHISLDNIPTFTPAPPVRLPPPSSPPPIPVSTIPSELVKKTPSPNISETRPRKRARNSSVTIAAKVQVDTRKSDDNEEKDESIRELPKLPTLKQVKNGLEKRRKEVRRESNALKVPCAKCRLRKRAIMMRLHGFVKEDVFKHWAEKPGNCIEYMHADEPLPDAGRDRDSLFEESHTQEPGVEVEGGE